MIVKNEYVKIVTDKEYVLNNYLYDVYLETIAKAQYTKNIQNFDMIKCYLKFEEPFENILNKTPEDFDVLIEVTNEKAIGSSSGLEVNYIYKPDENFLVDAGGGTTPLDIEDFVDKKITAIGFGSVINGRSVIFSCIDTSNYSIYYKEKIAFFRKDIFSTDTISTTQYPLNLLPFSEKQIIEGEGVNQAIYKCYPVLYSIGLGTEQNKMIEEFVIGDDVDIIIKSETSFGFNIKRGLEQNKYPAQNLYSKSGLYPLLLKINKELQPHVQLYAGSGIVPLLSDYKYIIYKYRYYYFDYDSFDYIDLDEYFTTNLPNDTKGLFEIVTKIERSDV
jgi:hypothetical protein